MDAVHSKPVKIFTVDSANAMLPLVRAITRDLTNLANTVADRKHRLRGLMQGHSEKPSDPYHEELVDIEQILDKDSERVQDYIDELLQLGLEVRSSTEGLIDFPGVLEGKPVYLCWKFGEPGVEYWHDIDKGFAARQRIAQAASADLN